MSVRESWCCSWCSLGTMSNGSWLSSRLPGKEVKGTRELVFGRAGWTSPLLTVLFLAHLASEQLAPQRGPPFWLLSVLA